MNKSPISVVAGILLFSASVVVAQTQVSIPSLAGIKRADNAKTSAAAISP